MKKKSANRSAPKPARRERQQGKGAVAPAPVAETEKPLTRKQLRFVEEFLVDLNATQAAIRAGYSERTAGAIGYENLTKPEIAAAVKRGMEARTERTEAKQDEVVLEWRKMALADANELVEFRRTCCRFCWGKDFRYQRTAGEMERDREDYDARVDREQEKKKPRRLKPFDEKGGIGFDRIKDPNPACPECRGEGEGMAFFKDTRRLSDGAKSIYAGVELTKEGLKIRMHSKDRALEMLGRHRGLLKDYVEVDMTVVPVEELDKVHRKAMAEAAARRINVLDRMARLGLKAPLPATEHG